MTDRNPGAHRHSIEGVLPRIGEIAITDAIVMLLQAGQSK
jgi:hypothetical protein